ncbi:Histone deacetylase 2 [Dichanthelium oligosanthes]|uniref:histone deacetylase n=1 Tax=Dichanthelium oligosanthes TaxID=888268 RepID=A0A1E5VZC2_9POAL|nr:Histone deacetylase 2 [Dichanthelium oligosanthes]
MASSSASASPAPGPAGEPLRRKRILSSKLYLDVPSSKVPVVYSPAYDISFLGLEKLHPFDSAKWGRICRYLTREGHLEKKRVVEPLEACKEDLLVVHPEAYLNSLKCSFRVALIVEVPPVSLVPNWIVQKKLLHPFRKQVGGSILSAKLALERGWSINVGGGFHHCSAEEGGGFCVYADISLCIQFAFVRLNISSVLIIDLDAHQGNGHEKDFANDGRVYTLDMYNAGIYPFDFTAKQYIDQKIELASGTKTDEYLEQLDKALEVCKSRFQPQLIVYNAGTDILDGDPLGRLKVSPEGVINRDEKVFRFAKDQNIPLLMLTSGEILLHFVVCSPSHKSDNAVFLCTNHFAVLSGGYMKSSARVIADSIINLSNKDLIELGSQLG